MADPLSIAASIAGLISLADTLFRHLYKYGRSAVEAKETIQILATEVNGFSSILRSLEVLATELEGEGQAFEPALQAHHLIQCRVLFQKIEKRVSKALHSFNDRSKWEGFSRQLKWPFSASETKELLQQMSQCKEKIGLATSADTMRSLQLCLTKQDEQNATLKEVGQGLKRVEIHTEILVDDRKKLTLNFFMKPDDNPQVNLNQSIKLRQPTTGEWLTKSYALTEWLQTPGSRLWLHGTAGGGKTILAGAIIQDALAQSATKSDVAVAFFFCDYKKESTLTPVNILGAIATQLALQRDDLFELLQDYYNQLHPARALNGTADPDELVRTITSMCELLSQVIIVVDGLDECGDNTRDVLGSLSELADFTSTTTIALLSRDEVDIRQMLEQEFKQVTIEAHTEDLEIYVRSEMERRIRSKQLDIQSTSIKDQIQSELVARANGMFRWVVCQLDYLGDLVTDADRQLALHELPPTLSKTYLRLLQRINRRPTRVRKIVQRCLRFISFSPLPLTIDALRQAVSTPETVGLCLDESNTISEKEIASCCSSLIRKSADGKFFEFAHFSVREFLEDGGLLESFDLRAYELDKSESQTELALQCLRFIQMGNFNQEILQALKDDWNWSVLAPFPFFSVASIGWLILTKDGFLDVSLLDAAQSLFDIKLTPNFRLWLSYFLAMFYKDALEYTSDPDREAFDVIVAHVFDDSLESLHVASALNLPEVCSSLLGLGASVECQGGLGTPFCLAQTSFLQYLERTVGHFPSRESSWFNNLFPSSNRRNETIDLLKSAGASVQCLNTYDGDHSVFVTVAIIGCHLKDFTPVVRLLEDQFYPDSDDIQSFQQYLLTWLNCSDCHELADPMSRLFEFLMKVSAYETDWGFELGEQLWIASVRLGFDFTNDPTVTDSEISLSYTALLHRTFSAMDNEDITTLRLCLNDSRIGVEDLFNRGEVQGNLLHHAAAANAPRSVDVLLELGGVLESRNGFDATPLLCCDPESDGSTLKLLCGHGASVQARNSDNFTLWHICARAEYWDTLFLETLFNIDPDLNCELLLTKTVDGHTPLDLAIMNIDETDEGVIDADSEDKVLLLLDYCQQFPCFWEKHKSVFPEVARSRSKRVLEKIVTIGLKPEPVQSGQRTPLHDLSAVADYEWTEALKQSYPEAISSRCEGRLPLELYIERCLQEKKAPQENIIEALTDPSILESQDEHAKTPWEFICGLKHDAQNWETSSHFLAHGMRHLNHAWASLINLGAIKAYEARTGKCGVLPLLTPTWVHNFSHLVSWNTLKQALLNSTFWDPTQDIVIVFFKRAILYVDIIKVEILLEHGVDVHQRESAESSIEYACEVNKADQLYSTSDGTAVLQCLLRHSDSEKLREPSEGAEAYSILHRLHAETSGPGLNWFLTQLVEKGVDVNSVNPQAPHSSRMPPIVWHLKCQSFHSAALLLELGADPQLTGGPQGDLWITSNALLASIIQGSVWFLRKLLVHSRAKSIDINWGRTLPLYLGLDNQTDVPTISTPFHSLCLTGPLECVQFYVDERLLEDIDPVCDQGQTPLHLAAIGNNTKIIEYLILKGSSINTQAKDGRTPLHYAAMLGRYGSTKTLMQLAARSLPDAQGWDPRMYADAFGHTAIVELLDGPKLTITRTLEGTSLLVRQLEVAIKNGNLEDCRSLLTSGCPLNVPFPGNPSNWPLVCALRAGQLGIAQWLLANGADVLVGRIPDVLPPDSLSVIEWACKWNHTTFLLPTILDRYLDQGGNWFGGEVPFHLAAAADNVEAMEIMLRFLKDNADRVGRILQKKSERLVEAILDSYALVQLPNGSRGFVTALHVAARYENTASVKLLLEKGADPDLLHDQGCSALDLTSDPSITELLLKSGASPIPILTIDLKSLLLSWGDNCDILANLFHESFTKDLGIRLADILDLSAPSGIFEPPAHTYWVGNRTATCLEYVGFDLNNLSHGSGNYVNWILGNLPRARTWFLNSDIRLELLDPYPWEWINRWLFTKGGFFNSAFHHFRRRLPKDDFERWMNLQPVKGWSPLCRASSQGMTDAMSKYLSLGAQIDFEGCPLGSALIIASACGQLEAVKMLVRRGASIAYVGRKGPIDAISVARSTKVRAWLLVRRFSDQLMLHGPDDSQSPHEIKHWSGIVSARHILRGFELKISSESMIDYAKRLYNVRGLYRGQLALPMEGLQFPGQASPTVNLGNGSRVVTEWEPSDGFGDEGRVLSIEDMETSLHRIQDFPTAESDLDEPNSGTGLFYQPGDAGFTVVVTGS